MHGAYPGAKVAAGLLCNAAGPNCRTANALPAACGQTFSAEFCKLPAGHAGECDTRR